MFIRFENEDVKMIKVWRNRKRYLGRKVLSVDPKTNKLEYKTVNNVLRHDSWNKKCYRIFLKSLSGETHYVDVTEDHSVYTALMKKVKGSDIHVGQWLRTMYECEEKMRVYKIKRLYFRKWMYDLSVEKNENFTANACVVSNSSYFGARILSYTKEIDAYIAENKNKYGNLFIGSL